MASLKIGIIFLATICSIRGEVASRCDVTVQVDYPSGSVPSLSCSLTCDDSSSGLSITGVVYKRFSALQLNFQQMVKMNFEIGQLTSCTLVPYLSDEQLLAESIGRQSGACSRIEPTSPTTGAPAPTTGAPPPTTGAPVPPTGAPAPTTEVPPPTTGAPVPPTGAPAPTTEVPPPTTGAPAPTTEVPPPTTGAPAPAADAPAPTTEVPPPTTGAPAPTTEVPPPTTEFTTIPTTVSPIPEPTTIFTATTTTTLAPITYSCPYDFEQFENKCYRQFNQATTWARALSYCRLYGATLVRISSSSEYNFVTKLAGKKRVWTDVNDIRSENKHVFSDYKTSAYVKWAKNEPTGNRWFGFVYRGDDCVSLDYKKGMYDDDCDDKKPRQGTERVKERQYSDDCYTHSICCQTPQICCQPLRERLAEECSPSSDLCQEGPVG
ncbi:C-type lectin-like [Trinorchestia longiramus]|nr:C-type lectin-like [Trinorchestia longiramus]